jgi:AraC family L-rhamnose operon transcriptional activator RhaR
MSWDITYYDTGEKFFKTGEQIYINKAFEQPERHLHAHNFIEIAYVVSGSGVHCMGDEEYSVSKGDLFVINYDVPHEFRSLASPKSQQLHVYNCIFKPEFIDAALVNSRDFSNLTSHFLFRSFFPEETENCADIKLIDNDNHGIEELYEKMYREFQLKEEGYIEILRAYVVELLITIFRIYRNQRSLDTGIEHQRRQIMDKVIQYMKDNYSHAFKLEDLSVKAFLSRNYFCKLFKEHTGMTVFEYAQKIRVEEACRILKSTDKKIIDIASEVGYSDLKFFNQIFKRQTGRTPGEYKRLAKLT